MARKRLARQKAAISSKKLLARKNGTPLDDLAKKKNNKFNKKMNMDFGSESETEEIEKQSISTIKEKKNKADISFNIPSSNPSTLPPSSSSSKMEKGTLLKKGKKAPKMSQKKAIEIIRKMKQLYQDLDKNEEYKQDSQKYIINLFKSRLLAGNIIKD